VYNTVVHLLVNSNIHTLDSSQTAKTRDSVRSSHVARTQLQARTVLNLGASK